MMKVEFDQNTIGVDEMAIVRLQVKTIRNLGLWDKVCEYKNWSPWTFNEGRISEDEWIEFDDQFKNRVKEILIS